MNRYTVQVPYNFYSREVSVSRRRPPTTPVSRQNRRVPLCNDEISPQDTSFPGTSPGMSLDTLPNVGMCIDNDIDDYGSDSELSSNNSGQFNSTLVWLATPFARGGRVWCHTVSVFVLAAEFLQ